MKIFTIEVTAPDGSTVSWGTATELFGPVQLAYLETACACIKRAGGPDISVKVEDVKLKSGVSES